MPGGKREGAGRPAGSPNKATREIKELAQSFGPKAIQELARLAGVGPGQPPESEATRVSAIKELLDRGYGKASQAITGADGNDLLIQVITGVPRIAS